MLLGMAKAGTPQSTFCLFKEFSEHDNEFKYDSNEFKLIPARWRSREMRKQLRERRPITVRLWRIDLKSRLRHRLNFRYEGYVLPTLSLWSCGGRSTC